ncbi:hypothetical protein IFR05_000314 [Cadophora sp. M221]|nr:hypothetical protein IFR05_000314 [Cadophora sp. M221]
MRLSRGAFVIAACVGGFAVHRSEGHSLPGGEATASGTGFQNGEPLYYVPGPVSGLEAIPSGTSIVQSPAAAALPNPSPDSSGLRADRTTFSLQETSVAKSTQESILNSSPKPSARAPARQPCPPSVEFFIRSLPPAVQRITVQNVIKGYPGLYVPKEVLSYLKRLPSRFAQTPIGSILNYQPSNIPTVPRKSPVETSFGSAEQLLTRTSNPTFELLNPTSAGSQDLLPPVLEAYLKSLPPKKAQLPLKSILNKLADGQVPTAIRSYLRDLPSESAQLPVKSLLDNLSRVSTKHGVSVTNDVVLTTAFPQSHSTTSYIRAKVQSNSWPNILPTNSSTLSMKASVIKEPLLSTRESSRLNDLTTTHARSTTNATSTSNIKPLFTPVTSATSPAQPIFGNESPLPDPAVPSDGFSIEIAQFPTHTANKNYAGSPLHEKSLYSGITSQLATVAQQSDLAPSSGELKSISGILFTSDMWEVKSVPTITPTALPSSGVIPQPNSHISQSLKSPVHSGYTSVPYALPTETMSDLGFYPSEPSNSNRATLQSTRTGVPSANNVVLTGLSSGVPSTSKHNSIRISSLPIQSVTAFTLSYNKESEVRGSATRESSLPISTSMLPNSSGSIIGSSYDQEFIATPKSASLQSLGHQIVDSSDSSLNIPIEPILSGHLQSSLRSTFHAPSASSDHLQASLTSSSHSTHTTSDLLVEWLSTRLPLPSSLKLDNGLPIKSTPNVHSSQSIQRNSSSEIEAASQVDGIMQPSLLQVHGSTSSTPSILETVSTILVPDFSAPKISFTRKELNSESTELSLSPLFSTILDRTLVPASNVPNSPSSQGTVNRAANETVLVNLNSRTISMSSVFRTSTPTHKVSGPFSGEGQSAKSNEAKGVTKSTRETAISWDDSTAVTLDLQPTVTGARLDQDSTLPVSVENTAQDELGTPQPADRLDTAPGGTGVINYSSRPTATTFSTSTTQTVDKMAYEKKISAYSMTSGVDSKTFPRLPIRTQGIQDTKDQTTGGKENFSSTAQIKGSADSSVIFSQPTQIKAPASSSTPSHDRSGRWTLDYVSVINALTYKSRLRPHGQVSSSHQSEPSTRASHSDLPGEIKSASETGYKTQVAEDASSTLPHQLEKLGSITSSSDGPALTSSPVNSSGMSSFLESGSIMLVQTPEIGSFSLVQSSQGRPPSRTLESQDRSSSLIHSAEGSYSILTESGLSFQRSLNPGTTAVVRLSVSDISSVRSLDSTPTASEIWPSSTRIAADSLQSTLTVVSSQASGITGSKSLVQQQLSDLDQEIPLSQGFQPTVTSPEGSTLTGLRDIERLSPMTSQALKLPSSLSVQSTGAHYSPDWSNQGSEIHVMTLSREGNVDYSSLYTSTAALESKASAKNRVSSGTGSSPSRVPASNVLPKTPSASTFESVVSPDSTLLPSQRHRSSFVAGPNPGTHFTQSSTITPEPPIQSQDWSSQLVSVSSSIREVSLGFGSMTATAIPSETLSTSSQTSLSTSSMFQAVESNIPHSRNSRPLIHTTSFSVTEDISRSGQLASQTSRLGSFSSRQSSNTESPGSQTVTFTGSSLGIPTPVEGSSRDESSTVILAMQEPSWETELSRVFMATPTSILSLHQVVSSSLQGISEPSRTRATSAVTSAVVSSPSTLPWRGTSHLSSTGDSQIPTIGAPGTESSLSTSGVSGVSQMVVTHLESWTRPTVKGSQESINRPGNHLTSSISDADMSDDAKAISRQETTVVIDSSASNNEAWTRTPIAEPDGSIYGPEGYSATSTPTRDISDRIEKGTSQATNVFGESSILDLRTGPPRQRMSPSPDISGISYTSASISPSPSVADPKQPFDHTSPFAIPRTTVTASRSSMKTNTLTGSDTSFQPSVTSQTHEVVIEKSTSTSNVIENMQTLSPHPLSVKGQPRPVSETAEWRSSSTWTVTSEPRSQESSIFSSSSTTLVVPEAISGSSWTQTVAKTYTGRLQPSSLSSETASGINNMAQQPRPKIVSLYTDGPESPSLPVARSSGASIVSSKYETSKLRVEATIGQLHSQTPSVTASHLATASITRAQQVPESSAGGVIPAHVKPEPIPSLESESRRVPSAKDSLQTEVQLQEGNMILGAEEVYPSSIDLSKPLGTVVPFHESFNTRISTPTTPTTTSTARELSTRERIGNLASSRGRSPLVPNSVGSTVNDPTRTVTASEARISNEFSEPISHWGSGVSQPAVHASSENPGPKITTLLHSSNNAVGTQSVDKFSRSITAGISTSMYSMDTASRLLSQYALSSSASMKDRAQSMWPHSSPSNSPSGKDYSQSELPDRDSLSSLSTTNHSQGTSLLTIRPCFEASSSSSVMFQLIPNLPPPNSVSTTSYQPSTETASNPGTNSPLETRSMSDSHDLSSQQLPHFDPWSTRQSRLTMTESAIGSPTASYAGTSTNFPVPSLDEPFVTRHGSVYTVVISTDADETSSSLPASITRLATAYLIVPSNLPSSHANIDSGFYNRQKTGSDPKAISHDGDSRVAENIKENLPTSIGLDSQILATDDSWAAQSAMSQREPETTTPSSISASYGGQGSRIETYKYSAGTQTNKLSDAERAESLVTSSHTSSSLKMIETESSLVQMDAENISNPRQTENSMHADVNIRLTSISVSGRLPKTSRFAPSQPTSSYMSPAAHSTPIGATGVLSQSTKIIQTQSQAALRKTSLSENESAVSGIKMSTVTGNKNVAGSQLSGAIPTSDVSSTISGSLEWSWGNSVITPSVIHSKNPESTAVASPIDPPPRITPGNSEVLLPGPSSLSNIENALVPQPTGNTSLLDAGNEGLAPILTGSWSRPTPEYTDSASLTGQSSLFETGNAAALLPTGSASVLGSGAAGDKLSLSTGSESLPYLRHTEFASMTSLPFHLGNEDAVILPTTVASSVVALPTGSTGSPYQHDSDVNMSNSGFSHGNPPGENFTPTLSAIEHNDNSEMEVINKPPYPKDTQSSPFVHSTGLSKPTSPQTMRETPTTMVTQSRGSQNPGSLPSTVSSPTKGSQPSRRPYWPKYQPPSSHPGNGRLQPWPTPDGLSGARPSRLGDFPEHHKQTPEPEIDFDFNFHGGELFKQAEYFTRSDPETVQQAEIIESLLPTEIQWAFNDNSIDFYDPGVGYFYYVTMCIEDSDECVITEVAKSCDCYVSAEDDQLHYLSFNEDDFVDLAISTEDLRLPVAIEYEIHLSDTVESIAERYGTEVDILLAANPNLSGPDSIDNIRSINIPAQTHIVQAGDTVYSLSLKYEISVSILENLNDDLSDSNMIVVGQVLRVPAHDPREGFAYTVKPGDTLLKISNEFEQTTESIMDLNAYITDPDFIYPGQTLDIPISIPIQGQVSFEDVCDMCDMDENPPILTGAKFARAAQLPSVTKTTIEVGPTNAPIVADVPVKSRGRVAKRGVRPPIGE